MKPLAQQTLYEILEVRPDATTVDIGAAYEKARALYGPGSIATYTLLAPDEAELLMARLEEARATLLDAPARARYDERIAALAAAAPAAPWAPPPAPAPAPSIQLLPPPPEEDEEDEGSRDEGLLPAPEHAAAAAPERGGFAPTPAPRPTPIRLEREVSRPGVTPLPVAARAPPAEQRPAHVPDASAWTGEILRSVREARGISIQQISDRTKVVRHHIENIEADRFGLLPAPVYLRGILLGVARELRLDGQKVARSYLERMAAASGGGPAASQKRPS